MAITNNNNEGGYNDPLPFSNLDRNWADRATGSLVRETKFTPIQPPALEPIYQDIDKEIISFPTNEQLLSGVRQNQAEGQRIQRVQYLQKAKGELQEFIPKGINRTDESDSFHYALLNNFQQNPNDPIEATVYDTTAEFIRQNDLDENSRWEAVGVGLYGFISGSLKGIETISRNIVSLTQKRSGSPLPYSYMAPVTEFGMDKLGDTAEWLNEGYTWLWNLFGFSTEFDVEPSLGDKFITGTTSVATSMIPIAGAFGRGAHLSAGSAKALQVGKLKEAAELARKAKRVQTVGVLTGGTMAITAGAGEIGFAAEAQGIPLGSEEVTNSLLTYAPFGALEIAPLGRAGTRALELTKPVRQVGQAAAEEAVQETIGQYGSNRAIRANIDRTRQISDGLAESAIFGGLGGGIYSSGAAAVARKYNKEITAAGAKAKTGSDPEVTTEVAKSVGEKLTEDLTTEGQTPETKAILLENNRAYLEYLERMSAKTTAAEDTVYPSLGDVPEGIDLDTPISDTLMQNTLFLVERTLRPDVTQESFESIKKEIENEIKNPSKDLGKREVLFDILVGNSSLAFDRIPLDLIRGVFGITSDTSVDSAFGRGIDVDKGRQFIQAILKSNDPQIKYLVETVRKEATTITTSGQRQVKVLTKITEADIIGKVLTDFIFLSNEKLSTENINKRMKKLSKRLNKADPNLTIADIGTMLSYALDNANLGGLNQQDAENKLRENTLNPKAIDDSSESRIQRLIQGNISSWVKWGQKPFKWLDRQFSPTQGFRGDKYSIFQAYRKMSKRSTLDQILTMRIFKDKGVSEDYTKFSEGRYKVENPIGFSVLQKVPTTLFYTLFTDKQSTIDASFADIKKWAVSQNLMNENQDIKVSKRDIELIFLQRQILGSLHLDYINKASEQAAVYFQQIRHALGRGKDGEWVQEVNDLFTAINQLVSVQFAKISEVSRREPDPEIVLDLANMDPDIDTLYQDILVRLNKVTRIVRSDVELPNQQITLVRILRKRLDNIVNTAYNFGTFRQQSYLKFSDPDRYKKFINDVANNKGKGLFSRNKLVELHSEHTKGRVEGEAIDDLNKLPLHERVKMFIEDNGFKVSDDLALIEDFEAEFIEAGRIINQDRPVTDEEAEFIADLTEAMIQNARDLSDTDTQRLMSLLYEFIKNQGRFVYLPKQFRIENRVDEKILDYARKDVAAFIDILKIEDRDLSDQQLAFLNNNMGIEYVSNVGINVAADASPIISLLLGQDSRPARSFAQAVYGVLANTGRINIEMQLLQQLLDTNLISATRGENTEHTVIIPKLRYLNILEGFYTNPVILDDIVDLVTEFDPLTSKGFYRAVGNEVMRTTRAVKSGKTIWSPVTRTRNRISAGYVLPLVTGAIPTSGKWRRARKKANQILKLQKDLRAGKDVSKYGDLVDEYIFLFENNILGEALRVRDIEQTHEHSEFERVLDKDVKDDTDPFAAIDDDLNKIEKAKKDGKVKKASLSLTDSYQEVDDRARITAYFTIKEDLLNADFGYKEHNAKTKDRKPDPFELQRIKEEAVKRAQFTYPTYSLAGRGARFISRHWALRDFFLFPMAILQNQIASTLYAVQDLTNPNPGRKWLGVKRLMLIGAAVNLNWVLEALSKAFNGIDDEEDKALKAVASRFDRLGKFLYFGRDAEGNPIYANLETLNPYGSLLYKTPYIYAWATQLITDSTSDPDRTYKERIANAAFDEFIKSAGFGSVVVQSFVSNFMQERSRFRDSPLGSDITSFGIDVLPGWVRLFSDTVRIWEQGSLSDPDKSYSKARQFFNKATGGKLDLNDFIYPGGKGDWVVDRKFLRDIVMPLTVGLRFKPINVDRGLQTRSFQYKAGATGKRSELHRILSRGEPLQDPDGTRKDLINQMQVMQQEYNLFVDSLYAYAGIKVDSVSGFSEAQLFRQLKDSGVSEREIGHILSGNPMFYYPQPTKQTFESLGNGDPALGARYYTEFLLPALEAHRSNLEQ